jgi:hypothetical protein
MKKIIATLFFLLAATAVIFLGVYPKLKETKPKPVITTFEECAAAGYQVMESYPRQCSTPDGKFFVETIILER